MHDTNQPKAISTEAETASQQQTRPWWQNFKFLRALFPPKISQGDVMVFDDESADPFKKPPHRVVVLATRGKFVSYRWLDSDLWQNESTTLRAFAFCYVKAHGTPAD